MEPRKSVYGWGRAAFEMRKVLRTVILLNQNLASSARQIARLQRVLYYSTVFGCRLFQVAFSRPTDLDMWLNTSLFTRNRILSWFWLTGNAGSSESRTGRKRHIENIWRKHFDHSSLVPMDCKDSTKRPKHSVVINDMRNRCTMNT